MYSKFDRVAKSYDASLPLLPDKYVQLLQTQFKLDRNDKVIDLGCGSGLLTFSLARFSSQIQGLDSSKELIRIARDRDVQHQIQWICSPVEEFDFGYDQYMLIISFESFHLFPNPDELIKRCILGIKMGGYFSVGWCNYHWELPLKEIIVDVFALNGVEWGEWGYQACNNFVKAVENSGIGLSPPITKTIIIETTCNVVNIVSYLTSIDKAASLTEKDRRRLAQDLETRFRKVMSSGLISGISSYSFVYYKKCA